MKKIEPNFCILESMLKVHILPRSILFKVRMLIFGIFEVESPNRNIVHNKYVGPNVYVNIKIFSFYRNINSGEQQMNQIKFELTSSHSSA